MARPKGDEKVGVFPRILKKPTYANIEAEAKKQGIAVPTFIAELLESLYGSKQPAKVQAPTPPPRQIPARREVRATARPLERSTVETNFKKGKS